MSYKHLITKVDTLGDFTIYRVKSNVYVAGKFNSKGVEVFTVPFTSIHFLKEYLLFNGSCLVFLWSDFLGDLCKAYL